MPPFQKGQSGNPKGRPRGSATFRSLRALLADKAKGEEILKRYEQLAIEAEDEKVRLEANNMLAKYRDGEPEPAPLPPDEDDDAPLTTEQMAALMTPTEATKQ